MYRHNSFLRRYFIRLPIGLLLVLLLFAGALFLFGYVAHEVLAENEKQFDEAVFSYLSAHIINPGLTRFMKLVTWFASALFLQITYGVLLLCYLLSRKFKSTVEIAAIGLSGFLVNYFMKLFFHRLRPPYPLIAPLENFSFPSGHATSGFIFYGLLSYLLWKTKIPKPVKYAAISFLVLFSLLIGFSRIYLRLHYASDVIAGFCIGFAWLVITVYLFEYLAKKAQQPYSTSNRIKS